MRNRSSLASINFNKRRFIFIWQKMKKKSFINWNILSKKPLIFLVLVTCVTSNDQMTWIRKNIPETFKLFSIYLLNKRAEWHSIYPTLCRMCGEGNLISLEILSMFFPLSLMLLARSETAYSLNHGVHRIRGTLLNFLANQLNCLSVVSFSILCNIFVSDIT